MKKSDQNTLWRDFVEAALCLIVALLLLLFLSSCSEDLDQSPLAHDGGSTEETALLKNISVNVMAVRLAADSVGGTPLALISDVELGSVIRMSELDSVTLDTTGVSYMTRCTDTSGMFRFDSVTVHSPYVLLELSPWQENAYWEWDGTWSFDDDVLYSAIVDLRETKNVGINMMTYLEAIRVRYLVKQGMSFVAAKQQADREVLDAVGLFDATFDFDKLDYWNDDYKQMALRYLSSLVVGWGDSETPLASFKTFAQAGSFAANDSVKNTFSWRLDFEFVYARNEGEKEYLTQLMAGINGLGKCDDSNDGRSLEIDIDYERWAVLTCNAKQWRKTYRYKIAEQVDYETGSMTDPRDGKTYRTVTYNINGKPMTWMAENLNYSDERIVPAVGYDSAEVARDQGGDRDFLEYRNTLDSAYWNTWVRYEKVEDVLGLDPNQALVFYSDCLTGLEQPADVLDTLVCRYVIDFDDGYFGSSKLAAYVDSVETANGYYQGLCPDGWHIPQGEEWNELFDFVRESCGEICRVDGRMGRNLTQIGFGDLAVETYPSLMRDSDGEYTLLGINFVSWTVAEGFYMHDFSIRCVKH
jgi:uncharacterized protein (TIGR02145 family)